jgi:uridine kinase
MSGCSGSRLIAITGGSGSGKSWLADRLQGLLGAKAGRLTLDNFYRDLSHLSPGQRDAANFDDPAAIDWARFEETLRSLASGRPTRIPQYDFKTHCRVGETAPVVPAPITLVDGLWLLHRPSVRRLFDLRIFLDCPERERLRRRLVRDVAERGRSTASVRRQFRDTVAPMHRRFVAPQAHWADVVLAHPCSAEEVQELHAAIWQTLQRHSIVPAWVRETLRAELGALFNPGAKQPVTGNPSPSFA